MPATETLRAQEGQRNNQRKDTSAKPPPEIIFQKYFKSSGTRTYAAQVKRTSGGDHYLVLTEGKRDPKTDELRKSHLFVFSEDFPAFFHLLHDMARFIKANPVPEEVRQRRASYLARQSAGGGKGDPAPLDRSGRQK